MKAGLFSKATVAKYLGKRPQDIDDLIADHGLHGWLAGRNKGAKFMSPEQLMWELDRCEVGPVPEAAEMTLLAEMEGLCATVREALTKGLEPKHTRGALMAVISEYQNQNQKEAA